MTGTEPKTIRFEKELIDKIDEMREGTVGAILGYNAR